MDLELVNPISFFGLQIRLSCLTIDVFLDPSVKFKVRYGDKRITYEVVYSPS